MGRGRTALELETINRQICSVVRLREVVVVIPPQDGIVLHAARAAARDPPLGVAAVLPVAVVCFSAPEKRGLRMRRVRRNEQSRKRSSPEPAKAYDTPASRNKSATEAEKSGNNTRRLLCVGAHLGWGLQGHRLDIYPSSLKWPQTE